MKLAPGQWLAASAAVVGVLGGHDDFGGFFADFLQEGVGALVQQAGHVARVRVAAVGGLAALDDVGQAAQRVGNAHDLS